MSEGQLHTDLRNFLEANLPRRKKSKTTLGVSDTKLAGNISEQIEGVKCVCSGVVTELMRGVRIHLEHIAKDLAHHSFSKAQLSLGHSYSRGKVKFDVHRVDNMVIQSIALLDQLDKDINLFGMRIREWYSYHFPELYKLVPDQFTYVRCAASIMDRRNLDDSVIEKLQGILENEEKVAEVVEAARTSMGMDIADLDLHNVRRFAKRVQSLTEYRRNLHAYIKERMHSCAPSLSALIGEQVGARLISHAGSLTNLAKCPASTVQILGAEKALFRALKTRSNTPKYGLLFHSTFIGRASAKNKGRISRFLANKCTVASRIDCFSDVPVATFGEHLKQQVEDRLTYLETGAIPKKNLEVMKKAIEEAVTVQTKILKKRKKEAKKARKLAEQADRDTADISNELKVDVVEMKAEDVIVGKKAKRRKSEADEDNVNGGAEQIGNVAEEEPKKKKKKKDKSQNLEEIEGGHENGGGEGKRWKLEADVIVNGEEEEQIGNVAEEEKRKKKKKKSKSQNFDVIEGAHENEDYPQEDGEGSKKKKKHETETWESSLISAAGEMLPVSSKKKKKKHSGE